jgi:ATP-dependent DNA helicase DinG
VSHYSAQARETADILGNEGVFAESIEGFQAREAQQTMAAAVTDALLQGNQLLAEAGTGTGKTWAYLVPALLHGDKVIISTGTKALQDQLFLRDLPRVKKILQADCDVALLKGRANYLCVHRLETANEGYDITPADHAFIHKLKTWGRSTVDGDIASAPKAPESKNATGWAHWGRVTSTNENCLGQQCPQWDGCFVASARQKAMEAKVVVVNHYLLLADFALKDEGFGELLPNADTVIIDEAHQLPEIAGKFFGVSTSARQIRNLVDDAKREQIELGEQDPLLMRHLTALEKATADFRLQLGDRDVRGVWVQPPDSVKEARNELIGTLGRIKGYLKQIKERSAGIANAYERAGDLLRSLNRLRSTEEPLPQLELEEGSEDVHWFETRGRGFALHSTPLDVSKPLAEKVFSLPASWIFSSATLSVAGDFTHIKQQLGLPEADSLSLQSPFDYQNNSLLYLPAGIPERPGDEATEALIEQVLPILESAKGGAFLLFTSYRALNTAAKLLREDHEDRLLVQGERSPRALVDEFVERGNAWLLATQTFWEGVDVQGQALSVVVIDRLPFASPGDPVTSARIAAMNQSGNAFMDWQLPQAVINLKQGAGRLIRDVSDYGVLVLGDPRVTSKRYGQSFIDSLPPMPQTRDAEEVQYFLTHRDQQQELQQVSA